MSLWLVVHWNRTGSVSPTETFFTSSKIGAKQGWRTTFSPIANTGLLNMIKRRFSIKKFTHLYRPQRSCGKVMFLHVSVILSTGGDGRQTPPGKTPPRQTHTPWADPPAKDGHCSGRYASYWNAFLFSFANITFLCLNFDTDITELKVQVHSPR